MKTSRDGVIWEKEARYWYYRHGPLARVELGDQIIQGIDYAYTIHGWLKGVNSSGLNENKDMGRDGKDGVTPNQYIAKDAFGFVLEYFEGDYFQINTGVASFIADPGTGGLSEYPSYGSGDGEKGLFNGNIHAMSTQFMITTFTGNNHDISEVLGKVYTYDQLNRLILSSGFTKSNIHTTGNYTWDVGASATYHWNTEYKYDANGNIFEMGRSGNLASSSSYDMDNFEYNYESGTNKLLSVDLLPFLGRF